VKILKWLAILYALGVAAELVWFFTHGRRGPEGPSLLPGFVWRALARGAIKQPASGNPVVPIVPVVAPEDTTTIAA
jgi:1-acyl-sn-glycerol-3-phosphate acyltransferase